MLPKRQSSLPNSPPFLHRANLQKKPSTCSRKRRALFDPVNILPNRLACGVLRVRGLSPPRASTSYIVTLNLFQGPSIGMHGGLLLKAVRVDVAVNP